MTCGPNEMIVEIHDRMPMTLHREDYARWLSAELDLEDLRVPYPSELMTKRKIGRKVGNVDNNTPDILDSEDPQSLPPPKPPKGPKSGPDDDQPSNALGYVCRGRPWAPKGVKLQRLIKRVVLPGEVGPIHRDLHSSEANDWNHS